MEVGEIAQETINQRLVSADQVAFLLSRLQGKGKLAADDCPPDQELLTQFVSDSELRGLSPGTLASYRSILRSLSRYLSMRNLSLADLDTTILLDFLATLRSKKYAQSTISNYFSAISSLCDYMLFEGWLLNNPVKIIEKRYLRMYKKRRIGYSSGERKLISIKEMASLINSTLDIRNKAIITLLPKTGIRRGELINIDLDDIDWEKQSIRLKKHPKRSNTLVFFDDETSQILQAYLKIREGRAELDEKALFISERGTRLKKNGIYNLVTSQAEYLGLHNPSSPKVEDHFTPHCCRHWFTTMLARAGIDKDLLKELRGDARRESMDVYRHIDPEELRKAYLASVPELGI